MNGAASRRLGNYRKAGHGVIELWWNYYVVDVNRNLGRDYASKHGWSSDIKPSASGSFPTTFSIRSLICGEGEHDNWGCRDFG